MGQDKAEMIGKLLDDFDELITRHGARLTRQLIEEFLDKLSTEDGQVLTSEQNMRKTALIDRAWATFQGTFGKEIITDFLSGMQDINDANLLYYRALSDANIRPGDIRGIINARLGIDDKGNLVKDGYMKGLLDDVSVRNRIKQFTYQKIIGGTGFEDLRRGLRTLIEGTPQTMGAFKQFYRNFSYDTYVQVDRLNGALYAEKLGLKYFIYQGTRREGSRYFCLQRKGKVFTTEEAQGWGSLIGTTTVVNGKRVPAGPIAEKDTYNPLTDLGGYGCVDIASYISKEVAFAMRPDLRGT